MSGRSQQLLRLQGLYYLGSGLWPIVSLGTFERVTGPKVDRWLVRTVGLLAAVIGTALWVSAENRRRTPETGVLSVGSALAFSAIDVVYALSGRISKIYLLDAAAELALLAAFARSRD